MDITIDSTKNFEQDLDQLGARDRATVVEKIDEFVSLFPADQPNGYHQLQHFPLTNLNGYESSLYVLQASQKLAVILAVDEDPIFEQIIFTLFRAIDHVEGNQEDLEKSYKEVAESLYRELLRPSSVEPTPRRSELVQIP